MKTYSLGTPPHGAGIYYLTNKRTGQLYVGQSVGLRRRYNEWKSGLASGYGHVNMDMYEAFNASPDLDEWEFVVAIECPGATPAELLAEEASEIARLKELSPEKVLNSQITSQVTVKPTTAQGVTVAIKLANGGTVGQGTAARLLGRHPDTIRDKVRWFRDRGIYEVELEELLLDKRDVARKYST